MPELTSGQSINKALELILNEFDNAFIAGEDIGIYGGAFGVTDGLLTKFGEERIKDTPIAEDVIAGLAVGASMTSEAFNTVIPGFNWVLAIVVFLFSYSTMISWYYYGNKGWKYLFGDSTISLYQGMYLGCTVLGAIASLGNVIDFSDMMILAMAFPNILGLYMMSGEVRADLRDYFARVKSGAIKKFK